jgi:lysophospholipase L1-like esterase
MPKPILIIRWGESNSAGRAFNSSATPAEQALQPRLQILNNNTLLFEPLQIGVNNIIDHEGATTGGGAAENPTWATSRHGWEVPLSSAIRNEEFGQRPVYLVHTGQGGSQAQSWGAAGPYMTKLVARINAAKSIIGNDYDVIIWATIGINDAINNGLSYRPTYNTLMSTNISFIRSQFPGYKVPLLMSGLTQAWPEYTEEVKRVCQNNEGHFISSIGASESNVDGGDGNHWGYSGVQTIGKRMVQKTKELLLNQNVLIL